MRDYRLSPKCCATWMAVLLLLTSCASEQPAPESSPKSQDSPGKPRAPEIQGVPVPEKAKRYEDTGIYRLEGTNVAAVVAWYDREMPEGRDWGEWLWCEKQSRGPEGRSYRQRDTNLHLSVVVCDKESFADCPSEPGQTVIWIITGAATLDC